MTLAPAGQLAGLSPRALTSASAALLDLVYVLGSGGEFAFDRNGSSADRHHLQKRFGDRTPCTNEDGVLVP
jgi:hypothetical protein